MLLTSFDTGAILCSWFGFPNLNLIKKLTERRDSMPYNYSKLLGRIKEFDYTQKSLAKAIGKDECTISLKLNGRVSSRQVKSIPFAECWTSPTRK